MAMAGRKRIDGHGAAPSRGIARSRGAGRLPRSVRRVGSGPVPARWPTHARRARALAAIAWASPCSLLGLALGALMWLGGGQVRRVGRTLEFALSESLPATTRPRWPWPWSAMTLGHVILGRTALELDQLRAHEGVHVRQYERWGPAFLVAYPLASLFAWLAGRCPYRGNWFEQQAYAAGPARRDAA